MEKDTNKTKEEKENTINTSENKNNKEKRGLKTFPKLMIFILILGVCFGGIYYLDIANKQKEKDIENHVPTKVENQVSDALSKYEELSKASPDSGIETGTSGDDSPGRGQDRDIPEAKHIVLEDGKMQIQFNTFLTKENLDNYCEKNIRNSEGLTNARYLKLSNKQYGMMTYTPETDEPNGIPSAGYEIQIDNVYLFITIYNDSSITSPEIANNKVSNFLKENFGVVIEGFK